MNFTFLPIATAASAFISIFLGLHASQQFWKKQIGRIRFDFSHPSTWIHFVPVSPLTKLVTSKKRIDGLARRSQLQQFFSYATVLRYKELSMWCAGVSTFWFWQAASHSEAALIAALVFGLAWQWPELYLTKRAVQLQSLAKKELSYCVDMLRLFVNAGQNLEQAVRRSARELTGFWGLALREAVYRLEFGAGFEDALARSVACDVPEWRQVVIALKQARHLGVSISGTLKVQADLLRTRRKQKAEEQARSASVKIALPLVLCIFPALLIIYVAPAVLRIMSGL